MTAAQHPNPAAPTHRRGESLRWQHATLALLLTACQRAPSPGDHHTDAPAPADATDTPADDNPSATDEPDSDATVDSDDSDTPDDTPLDTELQTETDAPDDTDVAADTDAHTSTDPPQSTDPPPDTDTDPGAPIIDTDVASPYAPFRCLFSTGCDQVVGAGSSVPARFRNGGCSAAGGTAYSEHCMEIAIVALQHLGAPTTWSWQPTGPPGGWGWPSTHFTAPTTPGQYAVITRSYVWPDVPGSPYRGWPSTICDCCEGDPPTFPPVSYCPTPPNLPPPFDPTTMALLTVVAPPADTDTDPDTDASPTP